MPVTIAAASSGEQTLAVVVSVVATLVVVALLAALVAALRAARHLRAAAAELERDLSDVLESVDSTLAHASAELERVDGLIGSAEQLTDTVGTASRLAYASLATPLIKVLALTRGTSRASRRLRHAGRPERSRGR